MKLFIATRAADSDQMIVDFFNAGDDILRYSQAVAAASIPDMIHAPDWYLKFQEGWITVLAHANEWVHTLGGKMEAVLANIGDDKDLIIDDLQKALLLVDKLIADPNQPAVKKLLADTMTDMLTLESSTPAAVQDFQTGLAKFKVDITADVAVITQAATDAVNQAGADNQACKDLADQIKALKDEIGKYNQIISTTGTISKVGIGVAVVGIVMLATPLSSAGGFMIGVGIAMIGTGVISKIVLDQKIADDVAAIAMKQAEIPDMQNRAIAMNSLAATLNTLVTLNANAQSAAAKIAKAWQTLADDVNVFMNSLNAANTSADYLAERKNLQDALNEWNTLQTLVGSMSVKVTVSDTPVYLNKRAA